MDYMFSQHDLGFLDDVIPEKDKKKKEDEKKKKKKRGSIDSDVEDVRESPRPFFFPLLFIYFFYTSQSVPQSVYLTVFPAPTSQFSFQQHAPYKVLPAG